MDLSFISEQRTFLQSNLVKTQILNLKKTMIEVKNRGMKLWERLSPW